MNQYVEFHAAETVDVSFTNLDLFEYSPKGRWPWLQKVCFWVLRKLRAFALDNNQEFRRWVIDTENILDCVQEQTEHLQWYFDREPKTLLIGSQDYAEMMGEAHLIPGVVTFDVDAHNRRGVFGLNVQIIPWMKGVLVMP